MAKDFYQVLGLKRGADEKAMLTKLAMARQVGGSDYAGCDVPADGAVEGEVVEGEVTDKR